MTRTSCKNFAPNLRNLLHWITVRTTSPGSKNKPLSALGFGNAHDSLHLASYEVTVGVAITNATGTRRVAVFTAATRVRKTEHTSADYIKKVSVAFRQLVRFGGGVTENQAVGSVDAADVGKAVEGIPQRRVETGTCAQEFLLTVSSVEETSAWSHWRRHVEDDDIGSVLWFRWRSGAPGGKRTFG